MEFKKLIDQVGEGWASLLKPFMVEEKPGDDIEYAKIVKFLKEQKDNNVIYFPEGKNVYKAFRATPLEKVRVVLLGQDPYHVPGYANGLAFSTDMEKLPVSLEVMFDGIENDVYRGLDFKRPKRTGDLMPLAEQGVLLLNTALTVENGKPGSHTDIWKGFTENLIKELTTVKRDLIWISLGAPAKKLTTELVNPFRNFVYLAEHPAAAARAKRKWEHNNVFSKTNMAIKLNNLGEPINW